MLRSPTFVWPLVAVVFWSGCAAGPLGSAGSDLGAELAEAYAPSEARAVAPAAAQALTSAEVDVLWGELAAEHPELGDQSAGEEIIIRHVYEDPRPIDWSKPEAKRMLAILAISTIAILAWAWPDIE